MKLTEISVKRPVFATVIILALVVLGSVGYLSLNVDQYPMWKYCRGRDRGLSGASPEQVESR
jgi:HAE1 family hydrophobic/amphiphilic exporter-1